MELLYAWVEDFLGTPNLEFNFNPKYIFKFDYENKYLDYEGENSTSNIWGNTISNLSVIVGKNASGKTSLIQFLIENLTYMQIRKQNGTRDSKLIYTNVNAIFVFLKDNKLVFSKNREDFDFSIKNNYISEYITAKSYIMSIGSVIDYKKFETLKIINFNNLLTKRDYKNRLNENPYSSNLDLSLASHVIDCNTDIFIKNKNNLLNLNNYFEMSVYNQVNLISSHPELNKIIDCIPTFLTLIVENVANEAQDFIYKTMDRAHYDNINALTNIFNANSNAVANSYSVTEREVFEAFFSAGILTNIIMDIMVEGNNTQGKSLVKDKYAQFINGIDLLAIISKYNSKEYFKILVDMINELGIKNHESTDKYLNFIDWLKDNSDELFGLQKDNVTYRYQPPFNFIVDFKVKKNLWDEFYNHYTKTNVFFSYLDFDWNLSSGETTLFDIYSRLYSVLEKVNNKNTFTNNIYKVINEDNGYGGKEIDTQVIGKIECNNVLIFLDEPDATLHPEWQRIFVDNLIKFIETIYKDISVQIIIATHSPIILSDIPKDHSILLKKENNKIEVVPKHKYTETFGANIFDIFRNNFYISNTIGSFATKIINNVAKDLEIHISKGTQITKDTADSYRKNIKSIGEPIIREKLEQMLVQCSEVDKQSRICQLEKELSDLRSRNDSHQR